MAAPMAVELPPHVESSSEARAVTVEWAAGRDEAVVFALELVVSELVTNAVRHGVGPITLTLSDTGAGIRVGVHDLGPRGPESRHPDLRSPGGRGLQVVDRLSVDWGVERGRAGLGKTVWAIVGAARVASLTQ